MTVDATFYLTSLYPFQDEVLRVIGAVETDFYLSGGTAASRGYLDHRFSDDLDLFVNDHPSFELWADRVVYGLEGIEGWRLRVVLRDERFVRLVVSAAGLDLKVEMINDVPSHIGELRNHEVLGRLDSPENLLANKVTAALDRCEPKDVADIWGFCCLSGMPLSAAIADARSKAAGVFPADLARVLCSVDSGDHEMIRWKTPPSFDRYRDDLIKLGEALLLIS